MLVELARPDDEPELRRLLRENPIPGEVEITFEREPDWFVAAGVEGPRHDAIAVRQAGVDGLVASGARSVRTCFVGGRRVKLPYLGALRVDRARRGQLRILREGYAFCRDLHLDDEAPFALTAVISDNARARATLCSGRAGLPAYRELESFLSIVIPTRGRVRDGAGLIDRAGPSDLDEVAAFLRRVYRRCRVAPVWSAEDLRSDARTPGLDHGDFLIAARGRAIAGCLAVWDQRAFKQAVIRGYGPRLRVARPVLNLVAPWLGTPPLPPPGKRLEHVYLSHVAVTDPSVLVPLVAAGLADARRRGCDAVVMGMSETNPLLPTLRRAFRHRAYRSTVFVVDWGRGAPGLPPPSAGPVHLEVATL